MLNRRFLFDNKCYSLDALEPAAANMVNLKNKVKKAVLATSLGVSVMLTLILKASLVSGITIIFYFV